MYEFTPIRCTIFDATRHMPSFCCIAYINQMIESGVTAKEGRPGYATVVAGDQGDVQEKRSLLPPVATRSFRKMQGSNDRAPKRPVTPSWHWIT